MSYVVGGLLECSGVGGGVSVAGAFWPVGDEDSGELGEIVGGPQVKSAAVLSPAVAAFGAYSFESSSDGVMGFSDLVAPANVVDVVGG